MSIVFLSFLNYCAIHSNKLFSIKPRQDCFYTRVKSNYFTGFSDLLRGYFTVDILPTDESGGFLFKVGIDIGPYISAERLLLSL